MRRRFAWLRPTPFQHDPHDNPDADKRLAEAEERAKQLTQRAEKAVDQLKARNVRNQWTETVQLIARRQA